MFMRNNLVPVPRQVFRRAWVAGAIPQNTVTTTYGGELPSHTAPSTSCAHSTRIARQGKSHVSPAAPRELAVRRHFEHSTTPTSVGIETSSPAPPQSSTEPTAAAHFDVRGRAPRALSRLTCLQKLFAERSRPRLRQQSPMWSQGESFVALSPGSSNHQSPFEPSPIAIQ